MELSDLRGTVLNRIRIGDYLVTETYYPPKVELEEHVHKNPTLAVVLSGGLTEIYDGREFQFGQFSLIFKPAFEKHGNRFHENGAKCLIIELPLSWQRYLSEKGFTINRTLNLSENHNCSLLTRLQNEIKSSDTYGELALEGIIIEMFTKMLRSRDHISREEYPDWIRKVLLEMESAGDKDLSITRLAKTCGVHPVHLINTFKKYFHMTPGEFLRQRKVKSVCKQLSDSDKPLIDIALENNFSDQSHFNKFIRKYTGVTPTQFRLMHKVIEDVTG